MKIKIALVQMHIEPGEMETNFSRGIDMLSQAADKKSEIILFPELWTSGYKLRDPEAIFHTNQEYLLNLRQIAHDRDIYIGGSYLIQDHNSFYNRFILIPPQSDTFIFYDKIHLFRLLNEDRVFSPGNNLNWFAFPFGNAGLAICYDLRFPEFFRALGFHDMALHLLVAEWPLKRIKQWSILLQARAVENQSFFAAVNNVGRSGRIIFGGSSKIINPYGDVICSGSENEEEILVTDCDLDQIAEARNALSALDDRRIDLFFPGQGTSKTPTSSS
jgi:predicted amidohydrolase